MIKKIITTIMICLTLVILSIGTVSAEETNLNFTDDLDDVLDFYSYTEEGTSRPNVDIQTVSCIQSDQDVEVELKLHDDGIILDEGIIIYSIGLVTTHNSYSVSYGVPLEALESLEDLGEFECTITTDTGQEILEKEFSGVGENTFTVTFELMKNYEKCVGLTGMTMEMIYDVIDINNTRLYMDSANDESLTGLNEIDAGGPYNAKPGDTVEFSGSVVEGDLSGYSWIWTFDESSIMLDGQNAEREFLTPNKYDGMLYVYNSEGIFAIDDFTVNVNSTTTPSNGDKDNGTPGFEAIVFFAAIGVAIIILRKKR